MSTQLQLSDGTESTAMAPAKVSLRKLTDQYLMLQQLLGDAVARAEDEDADDDEIPQEPEELIKDLAQQMLDVGDKLDRKAIAVISVHMRLAERAAMRKQRWQRIKRLADRDAAMAERLKDYVERELLASGITEVQGDEFRLKLVKKPASVDIVDPEALPEEFRRYSAWEPKRREILTHWRATQEVPPGVRIIEGQQRLDIK